MLFLSVRLRPKGEKSKTVPVDDVDELTLPSKVTPFQDERRDGFSAPLPGTYLKMDASVIECQTIAEYVHFVGTPIVRHDYESRTLETPTMVLETRYFGFFRGC